MHRPWRFLAVPYGAGVALGGWADGPVFGLLAAAIGIAVTALAWPSTRRVTVPALLLLTGWARCNLSTAVVSPRDLRLLLGDEPCAVTVCGRLVATPELRRVEGARRESYRTRAELRVTEVVWGSGRHAARGRVMITTPGRLSGEFHGGAVVEVQGVLGRPDGARTEGLFDYRRHLAWRGIGYVLRAGGTNDWLVVGGGGRTERPLTDRFQDWAKATLARGLPVQDEALELLWAMVLGWKTGLTGEVAEPFLRTGTMHVFAISGLHVVLIAGILGQLLRVLQIPRGWCGVVLIPALWFYTAATGWQASAVRATLMMTLVILGWSLRRPGDLLNSLAGAAFLILLADPRQLFQASFQLSFFVVFSLAICHPPLERWRRRWLEPDPWVPKDLRPRWRGWIRRPVEWATRGGVTSLAAWLGSLPWVAYYFHLLTPVSLVANLLVVPLGGWALVCGVASLICGLWAPVLSELFNHAGWLWMSCMIRLSEEAAMWPGAWCHVAAPPPILVALYFVVLTGVSTGWAFRFRRALGLAGVVLAGVLAVGIGQARGPTARLTVLSLRGGDSLFFDGPGRKEDALIDTGDVMDTRWVVMPFLQARGINRLPGLALTHGDVRHVGGAGELTRRFEVAEWMTSAIRFRSPAYREVCAALPAGRRRVLARGDRWGPWRVLHPGGEKMPGVADDAALVLCGDICGFRVLLCSDLGRVGWRELLEREPDLRAAVLVAGMPSATEPVGEGALEAVGPRVLVISGGESPASERPSRALRRRLARHRLPVFYTPDDGSVTLEFREGRLRVRSVRGREVELRP